MPGGDLIPDESAGELLDADGNDAGPRWDNALVDDRSGPPTFQGYSGGGSVTLLDRRPKG